MAATKKKQSKKSARYKKISADDIQVPKKKGKLNSRLIKEAIKYAKSCK